MTEELKSHFVSMYHFLLEDKKIDPNELITLRQIGREYGISQNEMDQIFLMPANVVIPADFDEKICNLYDYARIIWADGQVTTEERKLLCRYIVDYGFMEENAEEFADFMIEAVNNNISKEEILATIKSL